MSERTLKNFQEKSGKTLDYLREKLKKLRTGRANPSLVEDLAVAAYGSKMELKNMATINVTEPRLIVIQPWDQSVIPTIEKAILTSNLNLTPQTDKEIIRITIPQLTTERRQDLVKVLRSELEETRVRVRGFRREAIEMLEQEKKSGEISEDLERRLKNDLQRMVEKMNEEIEQIGKHKEQELNEV